MDRRLTRQLLGLVRIVISITVLMLKGRCVMGRHTEKIQPPSNDFCHRRKSAEEEYYVIHFLCQWPSLASCKYRLFGSPILFSLTELSSIDVKDIASFIKFLSWFPSVWKSCLVLTNFFCFPGLEKLGLCSDCVHLWFLNRTLCVLK